jgi:hypothetical protein
MVHKGPAVATMDGEDDARPAASGYQQELSRV